jgi:hypothetical protein
MRAPGIRVDAVGRARKPAKSKNRDRECLDRRDPEVVKRRAGLRERLG